MKGTEQLGSRKKVAKNTLFLYTRTIISLLLNLYASRIVLKTLGISDFGIFSVVASIIASMSFITMSMNTTITRFLCEELGHADEKGVRSVFTASFAIMCAIAAAIFLVVECIGLWYTANYLVIPAQRLPAAYSTLHLSLLSSTILILAMPYRSVLVAYENIKTYASITIFGDLIKFFSIILLTFLPFDKLPAYALLLLCVNLITSAIYALYCLKNYPICRGKWIIEWRRIKQIGQYASWDTIGCITLVAQQQGLNLLINSFFGLIYNAAYGIANQVIGTVSQFIWNFLTAINPQIMKLYHAGRHDEMLKMMRLGSYFASFLLMFIAVPLFVEVEFVLSVWLGNYPSYASTFIRIFLIQALVTAIARPIITAVHAVGLVKLHNLASSTTTLLVLPLVYVLLKLDLSLNVALLIAIIPWIVENFLDAYIISSVINFSVKNFFLKTYCRIFSYGFVLLAIPYSITWIIPEESFTRFIIVGMCSVITFSIVGFFFVLNREGRKMTIQMIKRKTKLFTRKFH